MTGAKPLQVHQALRKIGKWTVEIISIGKPAKFAITAAMRKLIITGNILLKANRLWQEAMA